MTPELVTVMIYVGLTLILGGIVGIIYDIVTRIKEFRREREKEREEISISNDEVVNCIFELLKNRPEGETHEELLSRIDQSLRKPYKNLGKEDYFDYEAQNQTICEILEGYYEQKRILSSLSDRFEKVEKEHNAVIGDLVCRMSQDFLHLKYLISFRFKH